MKTNITHLELFAAVTVLGLFATPLVTSAELKNHQLVSEVSNNLNQNIYTLDTLADQMVFRYGWSLRTKKNSSKASQDLHKQMKKHGALTNALVKASRGKSATAFKKAAYEARDSVATLQRLRKNADVNDSVSRMIERSGPIVKFICANTSRFNVKRPLLPNGLFKKSKPIYQTRFPDQPKPETLKTI